jgi:hypothetical protein
MRDWLNLVAYTLMFREEVQEQKLFADNKILATSEEFY